MREESRLASWGKSRGENAKSDLRLGEPGGCHSTERTICPVDCYFSRLPTPPGYPHSVNTPISPATPHGQSHWSWKV